LVLRVKKERNLISGLQNFWLFHNPDKAKQLRRFKYEEGKMLTFASDHKTTSLVLQELKNLNIGQFLELGKVWDSDSPEVLAVAKWGESKKAKLIDKEIGEQTPMQYLQTLLAVIGVKLVGGRKLDKKREYSYLPDGGSLPPDFNELYAAVSSKILERYEEKVQKRDEKKRSSITPGTLDSTSVEPIPPLASMSYINNVGRGGIEIEQNLPLSSHSGINSEDAEKLRDIALIWWEEYYPEQMQSLIAQMYSWQAPGTKYDVATLAEWLEGEDSLIRDRITELVHLRER
jgi:hypothetical protein